MSVASGRAGQGPGVAGPRSGAGGVLEVNGREPDDLAAGEREPGPCGGYSVVSGRPMFRVHPVRAVPLAAFIPSPGPGRGRGAWGGSASEGRSGGANRMGALPPVGAGGRIACGLAPGAGWGPRPPVMVLS